MNLLAKVTSLVLASVLITCNSISGQMRQRPRPADKAVSTRKAGERPVSTYATQPFDPTLEMLPPNYRGHDIVALYGLLEERADKLIKGEFETTQTFQQRVRGEMVQSLVGGLAADSVFAFVKDSANVETVYDADGQTMRVAVDVRAPVEGVSKNDAKRAIGITIAGGREGSYVGTNAAGMRVKVKEVSGQFYGVAFANFRSFEFGKHVSREMQEVMGTAGIRDNLPASDAIVTSIKMDVPTAVRAKQNLRVLMVCRLVPPFVTSGMLGNQPTLGDPTDRFFKQHYLNVELLEVWFYDLPSGRVFAKVRGRREFISQDGRIDPEELAREAKLLELLPPAQKAMLGRVLANLKERVDKSYGSGRAEDYYSEFNSAVQELDDALGGLPEGKFRDQLSVVRLALASAILFEANETGVYVPPQELAKIVTTFKLQNVPTEERARSVIRTARGSLSIAEEIAARARIK